jgi:hypothetical protein
MNPSEQTQSIISSHYEIIILLFVSRGLAWLGEPSDLAHLTIGEEMLVWMQGFVVGTLR